MAMDNTTSWSYTVTDSPDAPLRYGLAARVRTGDKWETVTAEPAFSSNRKGLELMAILFTTLQLSPVHLSDEVVDFLTGQELARERNI